MRKILSYCKSHIYDIHAVLVAILLVLIIRLIKKKMYKYIYCQIDKKLAMSPHGNLSREGMLRIYGLVWLVVLAITAVLLFALLAQLSPFVDFSLQSGLMGCVYALCGEAFIKQIFPDTPVLDNERKGDS